jgi:holo-[acyl-carrier protein] synthase
LIAGHGVDLCEVSRIGGAISRGGEAFLRRIFTDAERRYSESSANRLERYAARFAAKEAAMKALGTGWSGGIRWHDCEVEAAPGGPPCLRLHGAAARLADSLKVTRVHLSLTHTAAIAMASVILEAE